MELRPVVHIGPPKTGTTSLQNSVLPKLGRPFLAKPYWGKALARGLPFEFPTDLPEDVIVSDERLGDFQFLSPGTIAKRLAVVVPGAIVVFVERNPLQQFYSMYRQGLLNHIETMSEPAKYPDISPDAFLDGQLALYRRKGSGFFAMSDVDRLSAHFAQHLDFRTVDFDLLQETPQSFVAAFSAICGSDVVPPISHDNVSTLDVIVQALDSLATPPPADTRTRTIDLYANARLSSDREDFLKNWRGYETGLALSDAFRFTRP